MSKFLVTTMKLDEETGEQVHQSGLYCFDNCLPTEAEIREIQRDYGVILMMSPLFETNIKENRIDNFKIPEALKNKMNYRLWLNDIALDAYNDNYGNVYYIAKNLKSDNEYLVFNKDNEVIWGNIEKSEWKRIYNKLENNKQYLND